MIHILSRAWDMAWDMAYDLGRIPLLSFNDNSSWFLPERRSGWKEPSKG